MITTESKITEVRQAIKQLWEEIVSQKAKATDLGKTIDAIYPIALNEKKVRLLEWYTASLATFQANQVILMKAEHLDQLNKKGVMTNNSDFNRVSIMCDPIHLKWLVAKDKYQSSLVFIYNNGTIETYAGDAVRVCDILKIPFEIINRPGYSVVSIGFYSSVYKRFFNELEKKGYSVVLELA